MEYSDLADIDRELEDLGSVPASLSRIVARYGGWGLELDEVDETLETLNGSLTSGEYTASVETESVEFGKVESVSEVQEEPEAEAIADAPYEVFQDDIDESVAQEVFVEAESHGLIQQASEPSEVFVSDEAPSDTESHGLIQQASEPPEVFVSDEAPGEDEFRELIEQASEPPEVSISDEASGEDELEQVEYRPVLPEELTPIEDDVLDLKAASEPDRHSFAEFVIENGREFIPSSDQTTREYSSEQTPSAQQEFDAVYFHESEEDLPATEELRAHREPEFDQYRDEVAFASQRPSQESAGERNPFRDSEYKRLLDLELDPSDFPQSEPTSGSLPMDDLAEEAEFEALDDDDIVEIEDEDMEIDDENEGATVTVEDAEVQDEIVEVNEDDPHP